jgi:hypothetical protein
VAGHAEAVREAEDGDSDEIRLKHAQEAARHAVDTLGVTVSADAITWASSTPRRHIGLRAPPSQWASKVFAPLHRYFFLLLPRIQFLSDMRVVNLSLVCVHDLEHAHMDGHERLVCD